MTTTIAARNRMLRTMAMEAHHSSIDAHGAPVPAQTAWEFITQSDEQYDSLIGSPMPRVFAAHYAAWGRDWKRSQEISKSEVSA